MRIEQVTRRHRNDFHYKAKCEHCDHVEHYRDGYADEYYCLQVVPHRYCPKCGLNSYRERCPPDPDTAATAARLMSSLASLRAEADALTHRQAMRSYFSRCRTEAANWRGSELGSIASMALRRSQEPCLARTFMFHVYRDAARAAREKSRDAGFNIP